MKYAMLIFFGWLALQSNVDAASFDCGKAQSKVEKLICADTKLSSLDEELAAAYRNALKDEKQAEAIRRGQRRWLHSRDGCTDANCLRSAYEARLSFLSTSSDSMLGKTSDESGSPSQSHLKTEVFTVIEDELSSGSSGATADFCQTMADNLNSLTSWPPAYCERPHNPAFSKVKPVQWRKWSVEEFDHRWHLLAQGVNEDYQQTPSRRNDRWTDEDTRRWREGIRSGHFVVQETILPPGTNTSYFSSRRLLRMRSASLQEMQRLRAQMGHAPLPIEELARACVLGHFIQLTEDGSRVMSDTRSIPAHSPRWQLWLYETRPGAYELFDQQWTNVTPGFGTGVLTHSADMCRIIYTRPTTKATQGEKQ